MSQAKISPLPRTEMDALLLGRLDELTVSCESNARSKNLIGVAVSVLVLIVISSMIVAAIVMINPEIVTLAGKPYAPREAITLEEAWMDELGPNSFAFQWLGAGNKEVNNDELLFEDQKNLRILSLPARGGRSAAGQPVQLLNSSTTLISNTSLLASVDYQGFKISPSKRYLLVWNTRRRQFRHSHTAKYFLYDTHLDLISMLSTQAPAQQSQSQATGGSDSQYANSTEEQQRQAHNSYEQLDSAAHYLNIQDDDNQLARFQLVHWFGNDSLLLIQNNDLYVLGDVSGDAQQRGQQATPRRLTRTGKLNEIYNGVPDWLYEEEILGEAPAFQVSPNARTLAYMSFNDSQVELMPYTIYGPQDQVIPRTQRIRYPKAGRVNPSVSVHLVDKFTSTSEAAEHVELRLPEDLGRRQHYINRIKWLTSDHLALLWLNRNQNESFVVVCARQNQWSCQKNLHLRAPGGWLDLGDDLYPLDDRHYLATIPKDEGAEVGSFKHLAKVSLEQPDTFAFLTAGRREVLSLDGVDKRRQLVYYTATPLGEPGQRQLYAARLDPAGIQEPHCVTCSHHPDECLYSYARLSPSAAHYVYQCEGPGVPRTELRRLVPPMALWLQDNNTVADQVTTSNSEVRQQQQTLLWTIEDNQELKDRLEHVKAMPVTVRLKVPLAHTNYSANVLLLLPPQLGSATTFRAPHISPSSPPPSAPLGSLLPAPILRARRGALPAAGSGLELPLHAHLTRETLGDYAAHLSSSQQYPMVVDVYGGPGSQKVDFRFSLNYGHYLASSRRIIYAMIDGRGSANEGTRRLFEMRHQFGQVEIEDQLEVVAQLTRNYSFIDPNKVAIWGWSYGGYAAAMALAKSNGRHLHKQNTNNIQKHQQLNLTASSSGQTKANEQPAGREDVFECAVSVAPVTNWIYYDTAYTERYMSSPYLNERYDLMTPGDHNQVNQASIEQIFAKHNHHEPTNKWLPLNDSATNADLHLKSSATTPLADLMRASRFTSRLSALDLNERYKQASLLEQINNIDKKRFLLIHGTADDNVHFQQSIMLMKRLIHKNVMFETRLYPDQDHGIGNRADKLHLGTTLSNFFAECFDMAY